MTEMLDPFILQVVTLRGPSAIVVFLIMLGYALKMFPAIPNRFIPLVNFVAGPALAVFLLPWPATGMIDPGLRYPDVAAWLMLIMTGFLLACIAWMLHAKFLRKFIDEKIPALKTGNTEQFSKPTL